MKRYDMMPSKWTLPDRVIEEEHPMGKWVKYEDVIELADENEMLKEEIHKLSLTHPNFRTI